MLRGVGFEGRVLDPGTVQDLPEAWARRFIAQGRAVAVDEPPTGHADGYITTVEEPTVRDPTPRRKRS